MVNRSNITTRVVHFYYFHAHTTRHGTASNIEADERVDVAVPTLVLITNLGSLNPACQPK